MFCYIKTATNMYQSKHAYQTMFRYNPKTCLYRKPVLCLLLFSCRVSMPSQENSDAGTTTLGFILLVKFSLGGGTTEKKSCTPFYYVPSLSSSQVSFHVYKRLKVSRPVRLLRRCQSAFCHIPISAHQTGFSTTGSTAKAAQNYSRDTLFMSQHRCCISEKDEGKGLENPLIITGCSGLQKFQQHS